MKSGFLLLTLFHLQFLLCQNKTIIYCFPGQGSDKRIFDSLNIDNEYELKFIEYGKPEKKATMNTFAKTFIHQIDTNTKYILLGVSLGGMICVELNEILNPEKTIIISSAKNRNDLPFRYKFQKVIPLYKMFPGFILLGGAKMLQPIVEPDRKKNKKTFKSMLSKKTGSYMKRTIGLIIKWERKNNFKEIIHIHGDKDHTLPFRKIKKSVIKIENGSHMMTLTRADVISEKINGILNEKN
jgi:hypothetical protein